MVGPVERRRIRREVSIGPLRARGDQAVEVRQLFLGPEDGSIAAGILDLGLREDCRWALRRRLIAADCRALGLDKRDLVAGGLMNIFAEVCRLSVCADLREAMLGARKQRGADDDGRDARRDEAFEKHRALV